MSAGGPAVAAPSWLAGAAPAHTVLTPNVRIARALREAADARAAAAGPGSIWLTARILTVNAWIRELWMESLWTGPGEQVLLNAAQEVQLWRRVILESEESERLLQVDAAAQLAADAWGTLHAWRIPWTAAAFDSQEDSAAFYRWSRRYAQLCEQNAWLDSARVADAISETSAAPHAPVQVQDPRDLTPQQRALLDRLPHGWQPAEAIVRPVHTEARLATFETQSAEVHAAAQWAADALAQGHKRIAIVYGNPGAASELDRLLLQKLHPAQCLVPNPDAPRRYAMPRNKPLSAEPLVRTALLALQLAKGGLPLAEAGSLLRSPFLGRALQERAARAVLDAELRRTHPEHLTLAALIAGAKTKAPVLATLLVKFDKVRRSVTKTALPSAWALQLAKLLRALDWPGTEALSGQERSVVDTWNELLGDVASLDSVSGGPVPFASVLHSLTSIARTKRVPVRGDSGAPIEVLPFAEAAGLAFDNIWVLGCTAGQLPAAARPNPFLPVHLLRARNVPGATAEAELEHARRILRSIRDSAPAIVFSHAMRDGERDLRQSPLLGELPDLEPLPLPDTTTPPLPESAPMEEIEDSSGPPLAPGARQRGGTRILLLQAACPFRAFAEIRLHLRPLESGEPGLNPRDRGRLLHDTLQMVWSHLQDSDRLLAIAPVELRELVEGSIRQCQAAYPPQDAFERELLELECERLTGVLLEWLESEKKRAPFTVLGHEQARTIELGSLRIDARVDRVDRVPGRGDVIIDYKTGDMPADPWSGDRMAEPQMPVYAISHPSKVGGLLFGLVSSGAMEFKGIEPGQPLPIEDWRKAVTGLADQFAAGVATLDPKAFPKTCEFCAAGPLCRVGDVERAGDEGAQA